MKGDRIIAIMKETGFRSLDRRIFYMGFETIN